jgi:2-amino-4-hydroxy-6-hydroxymethyldihydropteridine diphosphokinase
MILIALGANLPFRGSPPAQTLRAALETLGDNGIATVKVSCFYETEAWPNPADPPFVNAVVAVRTSRQPIELLRALHEIESIYGRVRGETNVPRTLDLDILDYDGRIEAGPPILPHPRLSARGFVLVPLADVAPGWCHPVTGKSVSQLLDALPAAARELRRLGI